MKVNEGNFIGHIKNKNQKGLEYIVDTYSKLVYKVVHSVLSSEYFSHSIDECVNDIFLSIWNNINCFDEKKASFKTWLIAISKYKAIDYKRQLMENNDLVFDEELGEGDLARNNEDSLDSSLLRKEKREELLKMISELSELDRKIFIKRYFLDEDIEGIACDMEVRRSVIDNRLSRGRKSLKEKAKSLKGEIL